MSKNFPRISLTIDSLANSGDGVGRLNDKVVFVPFALPGEEIEAEILQDKKTFAKAKVCKIVKASKDRIAPECPVFGRCGGCDWQNLKYDQQLVWKQQHLVDVLKKIAKIEPGEWLQPIQPAPSLFNYRNRIQLHTDRKGVFYFAKSSQQPVYIDQCPIATESINHWLLTNKNKLTKQKTKIELAEMDDGSVKTFKVDKKGHSELGFRQVNSEQNQFICQEIIAHVQHHQISTVDDLYCGQGNWSLSLAEACPKIHCRGIDNNPVNIKKAQARAPENCEFQLGDASELIEDELPKRDLFIIDPPRAGCSIEVIEKLSHNPPPWLVYISCHPATMARDLKLLLDSGWSVKTMIPVDMFPQTSHLECLTILQGAN